MPDQAMPEVSAEEVAVAAEAMRLAFRGYSVRLTRMTEDGDTYTAEMHGVEPRDFDNREDASEWVEREHDKVVIEAALRAAAQARAKTAPSDPATDPVAEARREGRQWWLAELDQYGNPKLCDGAHSERRGAVHALYLINRLGLARGRRFAVAEVLLTEATEDPTGANEEALSTLSATIRSLTPEARDAER